MGKLSSPTGLGFLILIGCCLFFVQCGGSSGVSGGLDIDFSEDGKLTIRVGSTTDQANDAALQSDGGVILAGKAVSGSDDQFALARVTDSGELDNAFGSEGTIILPLGRSNSVAYGVIVQSDQRIVAVGSTETGSDDDYAIVRFNSGGTLDTTFGSGGTVILDIGGGSDVARSVVQQSDGKLVVAGYSRDGSTFRFSVVRLTTSGFLDSTFSTNGVASASVGSSDAKAYGAVLQSDGRIVLAGSANGDFGFARFTTDGDLDVSFGSSGTTTVDFNGATDEALSLAVDSQDSVFAGGYASDDSRTNLAVAKLTSGGVQDASFGSNGKATLSICDAASERGVGVAVDDQRRPVVTGVVDPDIDANCGDIVSNDFLVARFTNGGQADVSFGTNGAVAIDFFGGPDQSNAAIIDSDGKIYAVGQSRGSESDDFAIARLFE